MFLVLLALKTNNLNKDCGNLRKIITENMIAQITGPGEILKRMKGNGEIKIIGIFYSLRFDKLKSMN